MFVLEEHDRIVATDRGSKQTGRVHGVRGIRDADAGTVREDALARLAVIRSAAPQVSADRYSDDHRAGPVIPGPIAHHRHLVAHLHHGRPDVIEELNLDDRLEAARGHADAAADDAGLCNRRIEHAILAVLALQAERRLEDPAFPRYDGRALRCRLASATSSPNTTIRGLRAISSFSVRLMALTIVSGVPSGIAGVSNAADVGSTSGEIHP